MDNKFGTDMIKGKPMEGGVGGGGVKFTPLPPRLGLSCTNDTKSRKASHINPSKWFK